MTVGPYTLRFDGVTQVQGPNYTADRARVALMDGNKVKAVMAPEHRFYTAEGQDLTDTAIRTTGLRDLYLALGDDRGGGKFTLRAYVSPLAPLIWLGGLVMALGGMLSLWGRLRVRSGEPLAQAMPAE
jgi:cytochrome c-type biogenesis protein CcmF